MPPPVISSSGFSELMSMMPKRQQVEQREEQEEEVDEDARRAGGADGVVGRGDAITSSPSVRRRDRDMIAAMVISMITAEEAPIPIWFRVKV
jgi:hypothetical protein